QTTALDATYWYTNLRRTVRFEETIRLLLSQGSDTFIEVSAHPVLTGSIVDTIESAESRAVSLGTLRRGEGGPDRFTSALAEAFAVGLSVDWRPLPNVRGAGPVDLPTYAFQRRRYWPATAGSTAGDLGSVGLTTADHPLLGAALRLADSDGLVLTGSLSSAAHPWLSGHRVAGSVLLPGAAMAELAIRAADEVGCDRLEELLLEAPLRVPDQGAVRIQIRVDESADVGTYDLSIHSRAADADATEPWIRNATAVLATGAGRAAGQFAVWPPAGAQPIDLDGFYDGLAEAGHGYEGLFRGLSKAWRVGEDTYAEVALPANEESPSRFGIHPALLDAALHGIALGDGAAGRLRLPSRWAGVSLTATGATALRVRLTHLGPDEVAVELADQAGRSVLTVDSLVVRPVSIEEFQDTRGDRDRSMFHVDWVPSPAVPGGESLPEEWAVLAAIGAESAAGPPVVHQDLAALGAAIDAGSRVPDVVLLPCGAGSSQDDTDHDGRLAERVHAAASGVLSVVREWLGDERFAASRLVVVTRGAVGVGPGSVVSDLAWSAVWGL
ncbi:polyketide synthase dehydratase domain-containing protein, partial [Embleya sp. NPDC127516]|uniref:polyketide synthase dehydratase domain-containing protein n=1 Tax=Embleya sp. NPDC127516 TaxID=3363990 RepID=UPI00383057D3